jgi:carboxypeptidase C (cathepsin A)
MMAPVSEQEAGQRPAEERPPPPTEQESVTEHSAQIGGRAVAYRAEARTTVLRNEAGEPTATLFSVAYTRTDGGEAADRPLAFVFNGGPGSSSAWLHLGVVGPRRVDVPDGPAAPPAPYRLVDNDASLLDVSDLVFIDPVDTGYSRPAPGQDAKQFHGFQEDLESVGEFIRLHTSRAGRWESPKLLVGESYGTTRAAGLANHLQERHGMYLRGVALVSAVLLFQTVRQAVGNDLPSLLALPTYAATAWYHRALDREFESLRALVGEVEEFAFGDYAALLVQGPRADAGATRSVLERLAGYTGLSTAFLEAADLRVTPERFFKELLRTRRRTVGRLDTRFTGIDADAAGEKAEYDPSYAVIQGPFTAAANAYLRGELGFATDVLYEVLNGDRVRPWSFGEEGDNRYLDAASPLRKAMARDPNLQVLLASGYFDLATPFAAAEWTFDQMRLDPSLAGNVRRERYEAGHMMYIHPPSRQRLAADLRRLASGTQ